MADLSCCTSSSGSRGGLLLSGLPASRILEKIRVDGVLGNLYVANDTSPDKAVFHRELHCRQAGIVSSTCPEEYGNNDDAHSTMCGKRSTSSTVMSASLMLRNWSTDWRVPVMVMSFLSSTRTVLPTRVLKKE